MNRKDCEQETSGRSAEARPAGVCGPVGAASIAARIALLAAFLSTGTALGGSVRVWPAAVVDDDAVLLRDVAELSGFGAEEEARLAETRLAAAPAPGGGVTLTLAAIREAISAGSFNMSVVTLRGAVQCTVSRPSTVASDKNPERAPRVSVRRADDGGSGAGQARSAEEPGESEPTTLRQSVIDYLAAELARYGGTADVTFESASRSVLDLAGPAYEFRVRRRSGAALGPVQVDVAVLAEGQTVQTVPLRATVRLTRTVVTARGPINQDAIIREKDVHATSMSFARLDGLGLGDTAAVVGQRAKRFIEPGSVVGPEDIEAVPLVTRGQIVALESVSGGISVASSAKAAEDGHFGQSILVRDPNQKGVEFEAVVVGLGRVRVGGAPPAGDRVAMGDDR